MGRPETVTTEQVYAQARAMFIEFGPTLPIKKIAEKLGVSDAALFKRFGSKEDLYVRAMAANISELPDFDQIGESLPNREKLETACDLALAYLDLVTPVMLQIATSKNIGFQQAEGLDISEQLSVLSSNFSQFLSALPSQKNRSDDALTFAAKSTVSALHMISVYQFSKIEHPNILSRDDVVDSAWNMLMEHTIEAPKPKPAKLKLKTAVSNPIATEPPQQMDIFG